MAKKGKSKISKVKKNNQTTNKMKKQGKLNLQRHRTKVQKQKPQVKPDVEYSDSDSASGDDWADMLDEEEQKYIMSRLAKDPGLLNSVPAKDDTSDAKQSKKRKRSRDKPKPKPDAVVQSPDSGADTDSDAASESYIEEKYEKEQLETPAKKMRQLLPIKTKTGIEERAEECEDSESEPETVPDIPDVASDSGVSACEDEPEVGDAAGRGEGDGEAVTAARLLAARRDRLAHEKLRIGALCSSLLEQPEKKLKNLYPIMYLMEEELKDGTSNLHSVRKLAALSAFEVFKDILPDYTLRHQDYSNVKLKKDTLSLYRYEKELLEFYKRYLQRLEKACSVLRRKKGDNRKLDEPTSSLALVALQCMCGLLVSRPQFNYSVNIAQSVVPFLGSRMEAARSVVSEACSTVFREDSRGDITLTVVRLINQLVKRRSDNLPPSALSCLLSLRIRDVHLDAETDVKRKSKQEERHKKRIVSLSKKEKKRSKKLKEVERELLETQAQESSLQRKQQLTEVTKLVFHIYFRILKTNPRCGLLSAVLEGLAKFTHVINLEYYSELVGILAALVRAGDVTPRERALCVRTALGVLAGAGDALSVDPATFHNMLYDDMLRFHAAYNEADVVIVLSTLSAVTSRARRVSAAVLAALGKRLATLALQVSHHAACAALAAFSELAAQSKSVASLTSSHSDECVGSGRYDAYSPSPEHCGAPSAGVLELTALRRHYHPTVREAAAAAAAGGLPKQLLKLSPAQIFKEYDGSQMSFKPAIPPPKKTTHTSKRVAHTHAWTQPDFKLHCLSAEESVDCGVEFSQLMKKGVRKVKIMKSKV